MIFIFYFACFNLILTSTTSGYRETLNKYEYESHLKIKKDDIKPAYITIEHVSNGNSPVLNVPDNFIS